MSLPQQLGFFFPFGRRNKWIVAIRFKSILFEQGGFFFITEGFFPLLPALQKIPDEILSENIAQATLPGIYHAVKKPTLKRISFGISKYQGDDISRCGKN